VTTPNKPQVPKKILVGVALSIMDDWLRLGKPYSWEKSPDEIKDELLARSGDSPMIEYATAKKILDSANSGKMVPSCQAGFGYITDNWRRNYAE
jgi:hypothetical protein